ncbi:hypothetical protein [Nocardia sp. BMG111209]|uniref:hypothetical protein n=1 Tax=Nocardia sp. BMG111209 TaxID=1160137 RepID=UPI0003669E34|nr:hypothetical protein [Nocardia sp. BMG111209]
MIDRIGHKTPTERFFTAWWRAGVSGLLVAGFVSWAVWEALDEPTHCDYQSPCSTGTLLSNGAVPLCCLWGFWCAAGVVTWLVGRFTTSRGMRSGSVPALLSGATVFVFGLFAAVTTLLHVIDATYGL